MRMDIGEMSHNAPVLHRPALPIETVHTERIALGIVPQYIDPVPLVVCPYGGINFIMYRAKETVTHLRSIRQSIEIKASAPPQQQSRTIPTIIFIRHSR